MPTRVTLYFEKGVQTQGSNAKFKRLQPAANAVARVLGLGGGRALCSLAAHLSIGSSSAKLVLLDGALISLASSLDRAKVSDQGRERTRERALFELHRLT